MVGPPDAHPAPGPLRRVHPRALLVVDRRHSTPGPRLAAEPWAGIPVARLSYRLDQLKLKLESCAAMDFQSAASAHHRRDDANNRRHHDRDPQRHHENDPGMTTSRRSISPAAAAAVNRSSDISRERGRERERERDRERELAHHPHRHHHRRPEPSQPDIPHRRHSRHRSPDHSDRHPHPSYHPSRSQRDHSRDLPRGRNAARSPERRAVGPASHRSREDASSHPLPSPHRGAPRSTSPSKRHRSPGPSFGTVEQRKARRERTPPRVPAKAAQKSLPRPAGRQGEEQRFREPRSPEHRDRHSKPKKRSGRSRSVSPGRRQPRSPANSALLHRTQNAPRQRSLSPKHRERSPLPDRRRRRSRSRRRTPPPWSARPLTASDTGTVRRPNPDPGPFVSLDPAPELTKVRRRSKSSHKGKGRDEPRSLAFDPVSGANSIDVNMSARGGYRGGFNPQSQQSGYAGKGQYGPGPHDPRGYAQSSGHGTPNSSFHGSPPAQSPYVGGGRGWNGQQQFSPQR